MPYAEYIKPNPEIKKDLLEIKNTGSTDSAIVAIAERVFKVREFIQKWEGRVGKNLIAKMFKLLAYEIKEVGGKPSMPIAAGYDLSTVSDVERYVKDAFDAFRRLDEYHLLKKEGQEVVQETPVDTFIKMTDEISHIVMGVEPVENYRFRCGGVSGEKIYNIQPSSEFGGRAIVELDDVDVERAKEISRQGQDAKQDHKRFVYLDEVDLFEKETEKEVDQPTEKCDTDQVESGDDMEMDKNPEVPDEKEEDQGPEEPNEETKPEGVKDDIEGTEGPVPDGDPGLEPKTDNTKHRQSSKKVNKGANRK